jgi:hypothetical protein
MIEGSGSIRLTNGSGFRRPKNMWIRWIRIHNTAWQNGLHHAKGPQLVPDEAASGGGAGGTRHAAPRQPFPAPAAHKFRLADAAAGRRQQVIVQRHLCRNKQASSLGKFLFYLLKSVLRLRIRIFRGLPDLLVRAGSGSFPFLIKVLRGLK